MTNSQSDQLLQSKDLEMFTLDLKYFSKCCLLKVVPCPYPNPNPDEMWSKSIFSGHSFSGINLRIMWIELTLLHSERPKFYTILAFLSAIGLKMVIRIIVLADVSFDKVSHRLYS